VDEVVARAGLTTWEVTGDNLPPLADALRGRPGVEQVVPFGNTLHVTGRDATRLEAAVATWRAAGGHRWTRIPAGLEDVFISLMETAKDNFA
jgi:ABC-2 type transport system ATP-binding protein